MKTSEKSLSFSTQQKKKNDKKVYETYWTDYWSDWSDEITIIYDWKIVHMARMEMMCS